MPRHAPPPPYYAPAVWPAWIAIGIGWCIARLPIPALFFVGRLVGRLLFHLARSRRQAAATNLAMCLPHLDAATRHQLLRDNFVHTALGALEAMLPWLNPARDLTPRIDVRGTEHYAAALGKGRGVLVLAAHFTTMDVISQPMARLGSFDVMYRYNKNPAWEWLQLTGRKRFFDGVIEREDIRQVLKRLKAGRAIWYATDQDYGRKHSVFAPFFGVPAATITATSRFARLNESPVLFMTTARDLERQRWSITFHPALTGFPSGDDLTDATRLNGLIEGFILERPEQYLWMHKRFKTRPEGKADFYL